MSVAEKAIQKLETLGSGRGGPWPRWDEAYETLIKSIDWNRVRLEAHGRCLKLHPDLEDYDMPCGDCLEAALLVRETFPVW